MSWSTTAGVWVAKPWALPVLVEVLRKASSRVRGRVAGRVGVACGPVTTSDEPRVGARLKAAWEADPVDDAMLAEALLEAIEVARLPGASGLPPVAELAGDLADVYERLGRVDDAVAAMREAIEAGWNGVPDGRCRIAEILTAAGRLDEASEIWRQVVAEFPDDVWVHNNAGIEYARAGEHETALGYLTRGLELALDGGDPERLVGQLSDFRGRSLAALGQDPDELQDRAAWFLTAPPARSASHAAPGSAAGASSSSAVLPAALAALPTAAEPPVFDPGHERSAPAVLAVAWFPAEEFQEAITRWPELPGWWEASEYAGYCALLEGQMTRIAEATGTALWLAPVAVAAYLSWCESAGLDSADRGSRAAYAAELASTGKAVRWPPGRNEACWCGSRRKYKQCCRAAAQRAAHREASSG